MSSNRDYHLNKRIESGVFYHTATYTGNKVCDRCPHRWTWKNFCLKFKTNIKKINQSNGGFHHEPCQACLDYKLQEEDIAYLKLQYYKWRK